LEMLFSDLKLGITHNYQKEQQLAKLNNPWTKIT